MKQIMIILSVSFCILITGCPAIDTDTSELIPGKNEKAIGTETGTHTPIIVGTITDFGPNGLEVYDNDLYWGITWTVGEYEQKAKYFNEWVKTRKEGDETVVFDRETYDRERAAWLENESKVYGFFANNSGEYGRVERSYGNEEHDEIIGYFQTIAHSYQNACDNNHIAMMFVKYHPEWHYPEAFLMFIFLEYNDDGRLEGKEGGFTISDFNMGELAPDNYFTKLETASIAASENRRNMVKGLVQYVSNSDIVEYTARQDMTASEIANALMEAGSSNSNIADVLVQTRTRRSQLASEFAYYYGKTEKELAEHLALVGVNEIVEALTRIGLSESEINDALARAGVSE